MDYVGIGKRIRTQRLKKDLSQEELALELEGCSHAQLLALRQILASSKDAITKYWK